MGTNEEVRKAQLENTSVPAESLAIFSMLARSTDVAEDDVKRIMEALGFFRVYPEAVRLNGGEDLPAGAVRIGIKIGEMGVVI
jgi:hypothetical protein